jgi:hypothetical protein
MENKAGVTFAPTGAAEGAVEMDPSRRYIRYPILLGRGACKRVYKGEVAAVLVGLLFMIPVTF